jgi:hypothetical protein
VELRIPVMWATDYGDVGQSRSEATLDVFYISYVAHITGIRKSPGIFFHEAS